MRNLWRDREFGQAIVGNVRHGGRGPFKKEEATRPHEPDVFLPEGPPLLGNLEAHARTVQSSCRLSVCRLHGARGGGPKGKRNGMFKHGLYTNEAVKERRLLRELLRQSRRMLSTQPSTPRMSRMCG